MRIALSPLCLLSLCLAACEPQVDFSPDAIASARLGEGLPEGFLLGVSTSPHQVEGNSLDDWTDWEAGHYPDGRPHVANGDRAGQAVDSWNRWGEDLSHLEYLGANAYRLGLDWARLEPQEGAWDEAAVANYRAQLEALQARGIRPFVTLHHFTLPRWVAARGGWEWAGAVPAFTRHVERVGAAFGDLVDTYVTLNEPSTLMAASYAVALFPPGVAEPPRALRVYTTLMHAHAGAFHALRRSDTVDADGDGRATFIGLAHHVAWWGVASSSPLDAAVAGMADDLNNEMVPRALRTGRVSLHVPGVADIEEDVPGLAGALDFLGLNYYRRDQLRADLGSPNLQQSHVPAGQVTSDMHWEVHPEGFYHLLRRWSSYGWPIYVTENGVADETDRVRPYYLRAHLYALQRAVADGADVRGYFHWTLTDNFEWQFGYGPCFGLFEVDFASPLLPRRPRASAEVFREAALGLGLPPGPRQPQQPPSSAREPPPDSTLRPVPTPGEEARG